MNPATSIDVVIATSGIAILIVVFGTKIVFCLEEIGDELRKINQPDGKP